MSADSIRDRMEQVKGDVELKKVKIPPALLEKGYDSDRRDYMQFLLSLLKHNLEKGSATISDVVKIHKKCSENLWI